jgi:hypothetical protein
MVISWPLHHLRYSSRFHIGYAYYVLQHCIVSLRSQTCSLNINTDITIAASPSALRKIFLDFPGCPEWNPFITSVQVSDPAAPHGTSFQILAWKWYTLRHLFVGWNYRWQVVLSAVNITSNLNCSGWVEENGETKNWRFIPVENLNGSFDFGHFVQAGVEERIQGNEGAESQGEGSCCWGWGVIHLYWKWSLEDRNV